MGNYRLAEKEKVMGLGPACPIHPQTAMAMTHTHHHRVCLSNMRAQHLIQATSLVDKRYRVGTDGVSPLVSLTSLTAVTHNCCRTLFVLVLMTTDDPSAYVRTSTCECVLCITITEVLFRVASGCGFWLWQGTAMNGFHWLVAVTTSSELAIGIRYVRDGSDAAKTSISIQGTQYRE